jgi:hypothetical protein
VARRIVAAGEREELPAPTELRTGAAEVATEWEAA